MRKSGMFMAGLIAVIGLMIIAAPAEFIKVVVILLGVVSIVNGIINIATVSSLLNDSYFKKDVLIRGWSSVLIGMAAVALPLVFAAAMWTIMLYVLAVYLILSAGMELYAVLRLKKAGIETKHYVIEILASVVSAALLFIIPGEIGILLVRIIGSIFIVLGAGLIVYYAKAKPIVIEPDSLVDDMDGNSDSSTQSE